MYNSLSEKLKKNQFLKKRKTLTNQKIRKKIDENNGDIVAINEFHFFFKLKQSWLHLVVKYNGYF